MYGFRLTFRIDRRMRLQEQLAVHVRDFHRIIDQPDFRTDGHERKQRGDILRVHANATVSDRHANSHRIVGPVKHVTSATDSESHRVITERIVRSRWHNLRQRVAVGDVLLAN